MAEWRNLQWKSLSPLLHLRYGDSIPDVITDLGQLAEIKMTFTHFQKHFFNQIP